MRRSNRKHGTPGTDPESHGPLTDRGQVEPRMVLVGMVALILIGPLTAVAIDIQTALASTPMISSLTAALLALLIVLGILAAAVEGE